MLTTPTRMSATSSIERKQLTSAVAELRRILSEEVALLLEEIAELGASDDAVKELRYLLGEDTQVILDEIDELGGPVDYRKWFYFKVDDLRMIINNAAKK